MRFPGMALLAVIAAAQHISPPSDPPATRLPATPSQPVAAPPIASPPVAARPVAPPPAPPQSALDRAVAARNARRDNTRYDNYFRKYSKRYFGVGFDWQYFEAQGMAESDLTATARSWVGARGVMQLMPSTFQVIQSQRPEFSSIDDPEWNIAAGIMHDRDLWRLWAPVPETERTNFMFGSYNAGEGTIACVGSGTRQTARSIPLAEHRAWSRTGSTAVALPRDTRVREEDRRELRNAARGGAGRGSTGRAQVIEGGGVFAHHHVREHLRPFARDHAVAHHPGEREAERPTR